MPEDNDMISLAGSGYDTGYVPYGSISPNGQNTRGATGNEGVLKPVPKRAEFNYEVGTPYYLPYVTPYKGSYQVLRNDKVTIRQLEAMRRNSGQARALFRLITQPIMSALKNATIVPAENVEGGVEEAAFIDQMLHLPPEGGGMVISFEKVMAQMLLAVFHGFSAFEMVYWVPVKGALQGKITLRKMSYRPPETLSVLVNESSEFDGYRQRTFLQGRVVDVKIPAQNCIYYAHGEEENPFYGVSMFESAWGHYDQVSRVYYLSGLAAQRSAVGLKVGTMGPNTNSADRKNFEAALGNLGLSPYIMLPSESWTVQALNESGRGFDFMGYINHHLNQMSKSVLAQWFDDDTGNGQNGSTAVDFSRNDDSLFIMQLQTIMQGMRAVINHQVIPQFIDWNFGTEKYPTFNWGPFTDEQRAAIAVTFNTLAAAGDNMNVSDEYMHALEQSQARAQGLPIDFDAQDAKWKAEQILKDKLSQLELVQQIKAATYPPVDPNNPPVAAPPAGGAPTKKAPVKTPSKTNKGNPNPNPPPPQVSPKPKPDAKS